MCIIAISKKGIRQPNKSELLTMWERNPHGAGYMFINKDNQVEIHKGFMSFTDFYRNVCNEHFTKNDTVIYHFRIATQGGINPEMTHPFPLTKRLENTKILDCICPYGIAHNGIIPVTSNSKDKEYSDTARFITEYLVNFIQSPDDLMDKSVLDKIENLINSRMVILDSLGRVTTIGKFIEDESGILYSNTTYKSLTVQNVNLFDKRTWLVHNYI